MTTFQFVALALFVVLAAVAFRADLLAAVKKLFGGKPALDVKPSIAIVIVDDLIAVTQLRDKLAAEDCPEGVDACTNLLRVIVEQSTPTKTAR